MTSLGHYIEWNRHNVIDHPCESLSFVPEIHFLRCQENLVIYSAFQATAYAGEESVAKQVQEGRLFMQILKCRLERAGQRREVIEERINASDLLTRKASLNEFVRRRDNDAYAEGRSRCQASAKGQGVNAGVRTSTRESTEMAENHRGASALLTRKASLDAIIRRWRNEELPGTLIIHARLQALWLLSTRRGRTWQLHDDYVAEKGG